LCDPGNPAVLTALFPRSANNMMSAIENGAPVYQPAQLLNWVYMSLQDTQSSTFDAFKADTSPLDMNISKRSAADLSANYLNNFFHLRSEVEFMSCSAGCHIKRLALCTVVFKRHAHSVICF